MKFIQTCVLLVVFLFYCSTAQKLTVPEGFVRYAKPTKSVKAITADGVRLKTFRFPNEPEGDLELWAASIREHLERTGYRITAAEPVVAGNLKGIVNETEAQYQGNEFAYLIAVFVKEDSVFTLEAVGEKASYEKVRSALIHSLTTFETD